MVHIHQVFKRWFWLFFFHFHLFFRFVTSLQFHSRVISQFILFITYKLLKSINGNLDCFHNSNSILSCKDSRKNNHWVVCRWWRLQYEPNSLGRSRPESVRSTDVWRRRLEHLSFLRDSTCKEEWHVCHRMVYRARLRLRRGWSGITNWGRWNMVYLVRIYQFRMRVQHRVKFSSNRIELCDRRPWRVRIKVSMGFRRCNVDLWWIINYYSKGKEKPERLSWAEIW